MADHLITSDPGGRPRLPHPCHGRGGLEGTGCPQAVDVILTAHPELDCRRGTGRAGLRRRGRAEQGKCPACTGWMWRTSLCPTDGVWQRVMGTGDKALEELRAHHEPLLDLEGIRREVRERRGERDLGVER